MNLNIIGGILCQTTVIIFLRWIAIYGIHELENIVVYRETGKESDFRTKNLIATCQRKRIKILNN